MNLQTRCSSCGKFIYFKERAVDRFALARKLGVKVELNCDYCNKTHAYPVNNINARPAKYLIILRTVIFAVGTPASIFVVIFWAGSLNSVRAFEALACFVIVPYLLYEAIKSHQEQRVNYFNAKQYG
ncbi:hypothetical protein JMN32_01445 [Fulvivirga sp. 29W222]|uniref:Cxxc_20_cxxc protein n=1 Tax=Fulvivirga marina TaxID=2494733 RepID=A0A937FT57_9BACT|nr:hypothetical protein [Fulvivirga marina]MBL6444954.1 hypothetical protein [Fulvivirga marina]